MKVRIEKPKHPFLIVLPSVGVQVDFGRLHQFPTGAKTRVFRALIALLVPSVITDHVWEVAEQLAD